jgi:hypothetical protein
VDISNDLLPKTHAPWIVVLICLRMAGDVSGFPDPYVDQPIAAMMRHSGSASVTIRATELDISSKNGISPCSDGRC